MAFFFSKFTRGGMRRSTLASLYNMDATQLNDLGLTRHDIADAMRQGGAAAGQLLDARRSQRANEWLR